MEFRPSGRLLALLASTHGPMNDSHINVGPIACRLSQLTVFTNDANPPFSETVLQSHQPFSLKVIVEFSGPGAIALMPLAPAIQVEFYTKPLSPETGTILGSIQVNTRPDVLIYEPTINLGTPLSIGLRPKTIYRIGAVLRVGALDWPSLITGYTEEVTVEIYARVERSK